MRTYIIRAFLPWILFFAFVNGTATGLMMSAIIGIGGELVFNWQMLKTRQFFDVASFLYFLVIWFVGMYVPKSFIVFYSLPITYFVAALFCFISLIIKEPVTLAYAKVKVKESYWNHPVFKTSNFWISFVWGLMFFLTGLSMSLYYLGMGNPMLMIMLSPVVAIILALIFTCFFPEIYRNHLYRG